MKPKGYQLIHIVMQDGKPFKAYTEVSAAKSWVNNNGGNIVDAPLTINFKRMKR